MYLVYFIRIFGTGKHFHAALHIYRFDFMIVNSRVVPPMLFLRANWHIFIRTAPATRLYSAYPVETVAVVIKISCQFAC